MWSCQIGLPDDTGGPWIDWNRKKKKTIAVNFIAAIYHCCARLPAVCRTLITTFSERNQFK